MGLDPAQFEQLLGYHFTSGELLRRALTHSSWVHEAPQEQVPASRRHNEQFEFLGDAVLGFLISDALVQHFPDWPEGSLHRLKAHLVSAAHLSKVAERMELGRFLVMGRGEELSGGRYKNALLVNAVEALIAALYLDGGIDPARKFIQQFVLGRVLEHPETGIPAEHIDYISELMLLTRERKMGLPKFVVVEERGPNHAKIFQIEARLGDAILGEGEGVSKKAASQRAAQRAIERLKSS
jgi:ribonuclease-3